VQALQHRTKIDNPPLASSELDTREANDYFDIFNICPSELLKVNIENIKNLFTHLATINDTAKV